MCTDLLMLFHIRVLGVLCTARVCVSVTLLRVMVSVSNVLFMCVDLSSSLSPDSQGEFAVDELTMERAMEALERQCHENMNYAIETEEGLGIEYDEDVVCDVCRSPEGEDGNEMVFCDKCNICVHQVRVLGERGRGQEMGRT